MIGTYGNIVFETSAEKVLTFDGFERSGGARFAEHAITDQKPRLEFTGPELDEISFTIYLAAAMGVVPADEIKRFREIMADGEAKKLIIGKDVLGDFVLTKITDRWQCVGSRGEVITAALEISLKEFV